MRRTLPSLQLAFKLSYHRGSLLTIECPHYSSEANQPIVPQFLLAP
jgi:hypothetical protein